MKTIITLFILTVLVKNTFSQSLANYAVARNTGITYNSINATGNAISYWKNTTVNQNDDNMSAPLPIGFDFWYNGKRYTDISVCSNGYVHFSSTVYDGNDSPTFPSGSGYFTCSGNITYRENPASFGSFGCAAVAPNFYNGTYLALAPFYTDLWVGNNGANQIANSIKYELSGVAPNRVFTVEYIAMDDWATTANANYNFQVKLYEKSGIIEFVYGTMTPTGAGPTAYGCGINDIITVAPLASNLKMLQTANSTTFSNTLKSNLTTIPTSNSKYIFTPTCTAIPSGSLTLTGISSNSITLNWTNWATNEVGYVIYYSTDNVNFIFLTQTLANAITANATGLSSSTTYYFKLAAVTEGCISNFISNSATTLGGINKISNQTGIWSNPLIWTPVGVPVSSDNVLISNGHTVSIDILNAACNTLTVGLGGTASTLQYSGNAARSLTIGGKLLVNSNGTFTVANTANVTNSLTVNSSMVINGILDLNISATKNCNLYISKNIGNISISGIGSTIDFANTFIDLSFSTDELNITSSNFSAVTNFLNLNKGTLKFSTVNAVNITPFSLAASILYNSSLILNSSNLTINTSNSLNLIGSLTVNNGTLNVGTVADQDLQISGGNLNVNNGAINIAGKLQSSGVNDIANVSITGGVITVPTIGSTNTTIAPLSITGVGSKFNMSNGTIIISKMGGTATQKLGYDVSGSVSGAITGGTLQIGNVLTTTTQTMSIKTTLPIGNLFLNNTNATASLNTFSLNVLKDVAIASGAVNSNSLNIQLGGNWVNNGGNFLPTNSTVNFNSATAQTIYKPSGEIFNNLTFNGVGVKTFSSAVTTNSNITINPGATVDVGSGNNLLSVKRDFINSGSFIERKGEVLLNGTLAQNISGTSLTNFYNLTLNNAAGATLNSDENLIYTLTLSNGTFNTNGKIFTMLSTANNTARIASIAATANISGNVVMQRFAPGGFTGWALLGAPMSSPLTFADWNDDFYITCASCPDGTALGFTSIYLYDETVAGSYSNTAAYIPITNITNAIQPNRGYWVYLGDGNTNTNPITIDVTGTPRKFNQAIPITRTSTGSIPDDGWNLIQNPYPSPILWSALKGVTGSIDNAIYAYNTDLNGGSGAMAAFVNGFSAPALNAGGISDTIPMCQAFQVHSTGATVLNAVESNKVGGNPTFLKTNQVNATSSSSKASVRLFLDGLGFHDENALYLQSGATDNFDADYDAIKMVGQDPYAPFMRLMDYSSQKELHINGIDLTTSGNFSMPLNTTTGYNGTYTISLADYASFPKGACINLYDTYLNSTTDLKTSNYSFTLTDTTTVARFMLNITMSPLTITSNITQPNCTLPNSGKIAAKGLNTGPWNYYWRDDNNTIIKTSLNKSTSDTLQSLTGGNYHVEVNTVGQCDNNSTDFSVNIFNLSTAQFSCVDTSYIYNNGLVVFSNNSTFANTNTWDFGDLLGNSTNANPTYNYLSAGIYTVSLITESNTGCLDTTYKKVVIIDNTGIEGLGSNYGLVIQTKSNNEFVLSGTFTDSEKTNIRLINNEGKLISSIPNIDSKNLNISFDLNNYAKGIYYLEVTGTTTKVVFKLLVK